MEEDILNYLYQLSCFVGHLIRFCDKKFNFCKFANFCVDSKSRSQELSNDVSFVIFGHQTWDLEVGVKLTPPPSISWFSSTPAEIGLKISLQGISITGYQRGIKLVCRI